MKKAIKTIFAIYWIAGCIFAACACAAMGSETVVPIMIILLFLPFIIRACRKKKSKKIEQPSNNLSTTVEPKVDAYIETGNTIPTVSAQLNLPQRTLFEVESIRILFSRIPEYILDLLWIKGVNETDANEPSIIDLSLVISLDERDECGKLDYFPSYTRLTPRQRFIYLSWLEDISKPIDIGYVFLFYYGLERHLFYGDFASAYGVINTLQIFHNNTSFKGYSSDALLLSMAYHKRLDLLANFDFFETAPEIAFYLKHNMNIPIYSDDLIRIRKHVGFTNDRYIKENYDKFTGIMDDILTQKYGTATFLSKDSFFVTSGKPFTIVLANYSLDRRYTHIPNITQNSEFSTLVYTILQETHETYKAIKRTESKQNSNNKK